MKRTELKRTELMGRQGTRRVLHGPALHLFAVTRTHTKALRAETDHGTLRVRKQVTIASRYSLQSKAERAEKLHERGAHHAA